MQPIYTALTQFYNTRRYTPHLEITNKAKDELLKYDTVASIEDSATGGRITLDGFEISTRSGLTLTTKKLIFSTGVTDLFPDVTNFEDC